jgi:nucleotide-binding universal stress UspA family protein
MLGQRQHDAKDRCSGMMLAAHWIMETALDTSPIRLRRILVPVDFSESSRAALRFANALARSLGAMLEVVHVIERPYESPAVASEGELAEVQPMLSDFVASIGADVVDAQRVETGPVHQRIVSIADAGRFDLIVMGTAGRTGRPRSMAGSVAESVVRTAGCPVLTLREYPSSRI